MTTADLTATGLGFTATLDGESVAPVFSASLTATGLGFTATLAGEPVAPVFSADLTATGLGFTAEATGVAAPRVEPPSVDLPLNRGVRAIQFTVGANPKDGRALVLVEGPSIEGHGPEWVKHHGMFAIPLIREISGFMNIATPEMPVWVGLWARYYTFDGEDFLFLDEKEIVDPRRLVQSTSWIPLNFAERIFPVPGASHWQLAIQFTVGDPRVEVVPPAAGTRFFIDATYVPDNGYDLRDYEQPYLDGDQTYGKWEGVPRQSTSIFAPPPTGPVDLSGILTLEDDILGAGMIVVPEVGVVLDEDFVV